MNGWLHPIFWLINQLIGLFIIVLFVRVIMSWLVSFQVVNLRNPFVRIVNDISIRVTDPAMRPIQRMIPPLGGLDLSPLVLFLLLIVAQMYIAKIDLALI